MNCSVVLFLALLCAFCMAEYPVDVVKRVHDLEDILEAPAELPAANDIAVDSHISLQDAVPEPSAEPTANPTRKPSSKPTKKPTFRPTRAPHAFPTLHPTHPTFAPTHTAVPSLVPTALPTLTPRGMYFDSTFVFYNLSTNFLNIDDQTAIRSAAATVMNTDSAYVTFTAQTAESTHHSDALHKEVQAIEFFDIQATVTTAPPLNGQSPESIYATLNTRLSNAVDGESYIAALKLAQHNINTRTTFDDTTAEECTVAIDYVVVLGQPTAVPTPGPTGHRAARLPDAPLAGTVAAVVFGSALIALGIYFGIVYMRKHRIKATARKAVKTEQTKVPQVELPWQLDYGQPEHLKSVHRHELRGEVSASTSRPMKQGVVQIVFEGNQI